VKGFLSCAAVAAGMAILTACNPNPADGPTGHSIMRQASAKLPVSERDEEDPRWDYAVVDITPFVISHVPSFGPASLYQSFGGGRGVAPEILFGIGDVVAVSIFEASPGGLFIPDSVAGSRPGNFVQIPDQTVDRQGNITVPYVGQVRALGRPAEAVQDEITERLRNRAIEPQVIVNIVEQRASEVSVYGAVNAPERFAIAADGTRVLDAIARAGGPTYPGYESYISLQRDGRTTTVAFEVLLDNPQENIYLQPRDSIYVYREQRTYTAFGATGEQGFFTFDTEHLNLAQGIGRAGGLIDGRAEARHVFLYRFEPVTALAEMGVDVTRFETEFVPTIYRLDLREPRGFFIAREFAMRHNDVIYVSNSHSIELVKFLVILRSITSAVRGIAVDADDLGDL